MLDFGCSNDILIFFLNFPRACPKKLFFEKAYMHTEKKKRAYTSFSIFLECCPKSGEKRPFLCVNSCFHGWHEFTQVSQFYSSVVRKVVKKRHFLCVNSCHSCHPWKWAYTSFSILRRVYPRSGEKSTYTKKTSLHKNFELTQNPKGNPCSILVVLMHF